tara:strand:+ start:488 stop:688 length:201 start_codon:yes stop_codon:yes gene_type:complete
MGWLLRILIDDEVFLVEIFKIFRIGVAWIDDETGKASSLILGIWKIETNLTLVLRRKLNWNEIGKA